MDLDPDTVVPSVETDEEVALAATPRQGDGVRNVSGSTNSSRLEPSPSHAPFKTSRSRQSTPGPTSASRSSSVSSARNGRSTPTLDKKRSIPNLAIPRNTPAHQPQFRRASSILNPATPTRMKSLEGQKMTPATVAKDYFRKELSTHSQTNSEVVVYTHDSCYGHRFSRPRSSKAALASIVERPERIHAALLGASTAYVRLGGRYKEGGNGPNLDLDPVAIPKIPFTIRRTTRSVHLNHSAVTNVHGTKWMEGLQIMCDTAEANLAMGRKELTRPLSHTKDGKGNTLPALHSGDLYLSAESLAAFQGCLGGVFDAVDTVFQSQVTRRAFVCIRPPGHHCSSDMPSGFCWLNNVHVGISYAAMNHGLTHAVIVDFDLHHGDGSQTITWQHNANVNAAQNPKSIPAHKKIPIGYYSLHDINSYPCEYGDEEKVRNASTCLHTAHGQSIWNVHLESWKSHADFWQLYESKYSILLEKAKSFLHHHSNQIRQLGITPKAAIFLSSGFDASEWESEFMQRHQVNVPTDFYAKFTHDVVAIANQAELGVDGRVISVLEGGYSDRALTSGILSHLCGLAHLTECAVKQDTVPQPGFSELVPEIGVSQSARYDPSWWCREHLESLESMVTGNLPPPPTSKSKDKLLSNYTSPTQASSAKMTEFAKERVSISAQLEARLQLENAPPEPVPEVDWVTAAYELSRLLIPEDRQTLSCTHEELNAENSRARRDRQSLARTSPTDLPEEKMHLRDRKAKPTNLGVPQARAAAHSTSRRTTIAAACDLPDSSALEPPRTRRRSSASSSVLSSFQDLKLDERAHDISSRSSSRVGSSIQVKSQAPIPVRKPRAPAVKKPASATNSPRKARTAKTTTSTSDLVAKPPSLDTVATRNTEPGNDLVSSTNNQTSVDELTNGMKKISIKLKMPTQGDPNKQKPVEESSKTKSRAPRKAPVPKIMSAKASDSAEGKIVGPAPIKPNISQAETRMANTVIPSNNAFTPGVAPQTIDALVGEMVMKTEEIDDENDHKVSVGNINGQEDGSQNSEHQISSVIAEQTIPLDNGEQKPYPPSSSMNDVPKKTSRTSFVPEIPRFDEWMEQSVMYPVVNLRSESTSSSFQDPNKDKMDFE